MMGPRINITFANACSGRTGEVLAWMRNVPLKLPLSGSEDPVLSFCPDSLGFEALVDDVNASLDTENRPRCSLLVMCEDLAQLDYSLLRRLQDRNWSIAVCSDTDELLKVTDGKYLQLERLKGALELAHKFRIETDFLLTLPIVFHSSANASALFSFLVESDTRLVSFGRQLLLRNLGIAAAGASSVEGANSFFGTFLEMWLRRPHVFDLEDTTNISFILECLRSTPPEDVRPPLARAIFVAPDAVYLGVDGPVPGCERTASATALDPPASIAHAADSCRRQCDFFKVCGGAFLAEKFLYNGSVNSSANSYCSSVVIPSISRILDGALDA